MHPSLELLLNLEADQSSERLGLPSTRLLRATDVPLLCARDTQRLIDRIEHQNVSLDSTTVAVLPTAELVGWLHGRSDFYASKLHGRVPEFKGSIDEAAEVWIYWHHDFRRNQLVIQRISRPGNSEREIKALVSLLLDAKAEALAWKLSAVSIWSPDSDLEAAARHLSALVPNQVIEKLERKSGISMVRCSGGDRSENVVFDTNEFYAWN